MRVLVHPLTLAPTRFEYVALHRLLVCGGGGCLGYRFGEKGVCVWEGEVPPGLTTGEEAGHIRFSPLASPFTHPHLQPLSPSVQSLGLTTGLVAQQAGQQQQPQQQQQASTTTSHVIEVTGPLPPWTIVRACDALRQACGPLNQAFHVDLTTHDACLGLNAYECRSGEGGSGAKGSEWKRAGAVVTGESKAVMATPAQLSRRVVRHVAFEPGSGAGVEEGFVVRTSG